MKEQLGTLENLKVAIIGDISHSRVARSNIWALQKFGSEVRVAGPASMMPIGIEQTGAKTCVTVREACRDADIVMGLRLQLSARTADCSLQYRNMPSFTASAKRF